MGQIDVPNWLNQVRYREYFSTTKLLYWGRPYHLTSINLKSIAARTSEVPVPSKRVFYIELNQFDLATAQH